MPALLAVWLVGASAVLVDEGQPPQRLGPMLYEAGVRLVLGDRLPAGAIPARATVVPTAMTATHGPQPSDRVPAAAHPDNRAYLVYTSGTTGRPKGVEVTFRGLDTFLAALAGLALAPGGAGLNAVSPAFDGWLWCTLLYLLHGQAVVLADPAAGAPGSDRFAELLETLRPRTVCLTPSLLAACARDLPPADTLVVAGEPCPPGLLDPPLAHRRVLNVYGPTEATIAATWSDTLRGDDVQTIGYPLPGYRAYVLDRDLTPVPDGQRGELYLAGPALARGYCGQPGLTATRFVADPLRGDGSRMYRTGDLVRRRPDGALVHLGRGDDQLKIRGFRVEPAELERVAAATPGVASAAAFALATGDALGVAVVPVNGAGADLAARVRRHCGTRVPDHLRPAVVLVLESLPISATGKVDRPTLVARASSAPAVVGRRPTTDRERLVCRVWNGLLPQWIDDVDIGFFDAGGHSLLAAQAVTALRQETGLRISMRSLLANPTVAGLAAELDRRAAESAGPESAGPVAAAPVPEGAG